MTGALVLFGVALMIVIHEGAHFVAAKSFDMKATDAFFGFGPRLWSTRRGETEYGVRLIPFGGYVRIIGMNPFEEVDPRDEGRTYRNAPFWQKTVVVLVGIASHLVVAVVIFAVIAAVWGVVTIDDDGRPIPTTTIARVAASTADGRTTPASSAGVLAGDRITAFEGNAVATWDEFVADVEHSAGETVTVTVDRDGALLDLETRLISIDKPVIVEGEPVEVDGEVVTEEVGFFGVTPEPVREEVGPLGAVRVAFRDLFVAMRQSILGLWQMIIGFPELIASVLGGGDDVLDTVRPISPIGLVQLAGPLESSLALIALVNVFVAMLNVVPLYPLDGGHFAVALYEKVRGRTPDVRKLLPVAAVVFVFLVTVGLIGVYLDVFRPLQ